MRLVVRKRQMCNGRRLGIPWRLVMKVMAFGGLSKASQTP